MSSQFACSACGATFPTEAEMRQHGSTAHPMPAAPPSHASFDCKGCGTHFHTEAELKQHAAHAHPM